MIDTINENTNAYTDEQIEHVKRTFGLINSVSSEKRDVIFPIMSTFIEGVIVGESIASGRTK
jgi:hypothetical protein